MLNYDHKLFQLRIPTAEHERLKQIHKQRIIDALRNKNEFINISMHSMLLEAIKKLEK
jgi:hypothetical protein